jgi:hypothetical protein
MEIVIYFQVNIHTYSTRLLKIEINNDSTFLLSFQVRTRLEKPAAQHLDLAYKVTALQTVHMLMLNLLHHCNSCAQDKIIETELHI